MSNDILILGLVSGEHIMGEVEERNGAYFVSDVVVILSEPDQATGKMRMGMMPYMPYAQNGVMVPAATTILASPTEELRNYYSEKFGKIITPSTSIIT